MSSSKVPLCDTLALLYQDRLDYLIYFTYTTHKWCRIFKYYFSISFICLSCCCICSYSSNCYSSVNKYICDVLLDLVSVYIWRLHGCSNTCECMVTLFSTFMSFLYVWMSYMSVLRCVSWNTFICSAAQCFLKCVV